jgi:hypothetical protein
MEVGELLNGVDQLVVVGQPQWDVSVQPLYGPLLA